VNTHDFGEHGAEPVADINIDDLGFRARLETTATINDIKANQGGHKEVGRVKRLIGLIGVVAALATLAAGLLSATAVADPGTSVAFVVNNQFGGTQTVVVSSIPGCATGTVTDTNGPQAAFDGPVSLFSGTKLFDCGASGTFTLAYRVHHIDCAPTDSGTWMIVGGTGAYAAMTGEGLVSDTYFPSACPASGITDSYSGTLRLAGN
jgi:hypothetical protein